MLRRTTMILLAVGIIAVVGLWISLTLAFRGPEYFAPMPTFREVASDPVMLAGVLQSYASVAEVQRQLAGGGNRVRIIEDEQWLQSGTSVHYVVAMVERYIDRGHSGTLRLAFLNDRLATATFEPDDWDAYLSALKDVEFSGAGQIVESGSIGENVIVRLFRPRRAVAYSDRRLDRELAIYLAKTDE